MDFVSVLMPAYNCENYIRSAVESILNQTFSGFELIILNDGSTDNTHQIISSFSDPRIKYFQNKSNEGLSNVRNRLIKLASGKYIAFLDSDDIADKYRLEKEYNILDSNSDICLVAGGVKYINEYGAEDLGSWAFDLDPAQLKTHMLFYNPIVTSAVMFKRDHLPEEIFRDGYPPCEDYDLWVRMLLKYKGIVLPDFLAFYRIYQNSASKRNADDARNNRNKVITDQLKYYFENEYSEDEKLFHLSLVEFSLKNKTTDLYGLAGWIHKLILLNQKYTRFDERILKQILYERVLKKFLRLADYDYSVYRTLIIIKEELQPVLNMELRKKEWAILAFSLVKKKFIRV